MSGCCRGRRPLATGHVNGLEGSELAKRRLRVLLLSLQGTLSVREACSQLQIGESRFHAMRHQWLQGILELLEPRPVGRPPKRAATEDAIRCHQLEQELEFAQRSVARAELRHTVDQVLSTPVGKKKAATIGVRPVRRNGQ